MDGITVCEGGKGALMCHVKASRYVPCMYVCLLCVDSGGQREANDPVQISSEEQGGRAIFSNEDEVAPFIESKNTETTSQENKNYKVKEKSYRLSI